MNRKLPRKIDINFINEVLTYDKDTGVFMWKKRDATWFNRPHLCNLWNLKHAGRIAGHKTTQNNGYTDIRISIKGQKYLAHRLAWAIMTGEQPPSQIDHINRDPTDNRWCNLRDGTGFVNQRNKSKSTNNTSGFTGVVWYKPLYKWKAQVSIGGKTKHLGYFENKEDAHHACEKYRAKNHFHEEHGIHPRRY